MAAVLSSASHVRSFNGRAKLSHRIIRLDGSGRDAVLGHLKYLSRNGKGRDGDRPELYSDLAENTNKYRFSELTRDHRHQFQVVLEPERGWEYQDFRSLVGRFMKQVKADLRSDLDWVAADHYDNGTPHSHIVVAGRDRQGDDILIAPTYLYNGLVTRAAEIVSLDLGPDLGGEREQERHLTAERVIDLDMDLLQRADAMGFVSPGDPDGVHQGLLTRRLITLASLGLAARQPQGAWQLREDMLVQLGKIEQQNRDWRALQDGIAEQHPDRPRSDYAVWEFGRHEPVTGQVLAVETQSGGHYAIIIDTVAGDLMRAQGRSDVELRPDMIVHVGGGGGPADDEPVDQRALFEVLSVQPIHEQIQSSGQTWLDRLVTQDPPIWLGRGFGKEVRQALVERNAWLRERVPDRETGPISREI